MSRYNGNIRNDNHLTNLSYVDYGQYLAVYVPGNKSGWVHYYPESGKWMLAEDERFNGIGIQSLKTFCKNRAHAI